MQRKTITGTPLSVSPLALGTGFYGTSISRDDAMRQMDAYVQAGGNFFDTAHVYGDWEPGPHGRSERIIGQWLRANGREGIILSSKGAHPLIEHMDRPRVTPEAIGQDLAESLNLLGVPSIDLYFLHRDDPAIPEGELIDCLQAHQNAGRIAAYGCSNWSLPRIRKAQEYAAAHGYKGFACNQAMWSLADIRLSAVADKTLCAMDAQTYAYHAQTGLAAMAYSSNAKGYFTRRLTGAPVSDSLRRIYDGPSNDAIASVLASLARETGFSVTALSLAAMMHHPFVSIPIASYSNLAQLREGLESCDPLLTEALPKTVRDAFGAMNTEKRFILP